MTGVQTCALPICLYFCKSLEANRGEMDGALMFDFCLQDPGYLGSQSVHSGSAIKAQLTRRFGAAKRRKIGRCEAVGYIANFYSTGGVGSFGLVRSSSSEVFMELLNNCLIASLMSKGTYFDSSVVSFSLYRRGNSFSNIGAMLFNV